MPIVLAASLSGCVQEATEEAPSASPEASAAQPAEFDETTGAIAGLVTDSEIVPLPGALVAITDIGFETMTAADGSFSLSRVPPGTYNLEVQALGFRSKAVSVDVVAGQATEGVNVVLERLPTNTPHVEKYQFTGFITCSVGAAGVLSEECGQGLQTPVGTYGTNARNKIDWIFNLTTFADLKDVYVELNWEPASAAAQQLALHVAHNFTCIPSCDEEKAYCGAFENFGRPVQDCLVKTEDLAVSGTNAPIEGQSWAITARAWAAPVPAGQAPNIVLEQSFQMYRTEFYVDPMPEGYSQIEDQ